MSMFRFGFCALVVGALYGCGFLDMVAGVQTGPNGEVLGAGPGVGDHIADVVGSVLPWAGGTAGVGGLLRWGLLEYRSFRLRQAGKKDDNRDGVEDAPTKTL
jgi:hypothetical protein